MSCIRTESHLRDQRNSDCLTEEAEYHVLVSLLSHLRKVKEQRKMLVYGLNSNNCFAKRIYEPHRTRAQGKLSGGSWRENT